MLFTVLLTLLHTAGRTVTTDFNILRLLARQLQWKAVMCLCACIVLLDIWHHVVHMDFSVLFASIFSAMVYLPLFIMPLLDGLKEQSTGFRVALPTAYLLFVAANYITGGT